MARPLMPKATAVWLVENTTLTFEQIADFCELHALEVQAIADDEVAIGMQGMDPITSGQLTAEEIERCTADLEARLELAKPSVPRPQARPRGARYTPVSKRQDRPDAIAWLLKNYPEVSDAQISKLIGTTKPTINAIRDRTHWNAPNIKPQNPIGLGLCSEPELEKAVDLARARAGVVHATAGKAAEAPAGPQTESAPEPPPPAPISPEQVFGETPDKASADPQAEPEPSPPLSPEHVFGETPDEAAAPGAAAEASADPQPVPEPSPPAPLSPEHVFGKAPSEAAAPAPAETPAGPEPETVPSPPTPPEDASGESPDETASPSHAPDTRDRTEPA
jgi:hypothetical protein